MIHDYIKKIETENSLNKVKYKNVHLWLNIKNHFISTKFQRNKSNIDLSKSNVVKLIFSIFKNFHKWFYRYDYWFMGDSKKRKKIDNQYVDIFLDYPASKLKRSLFIELPLYKHHKNSETPTKNLVSKALFIFLESVYTFLFLRNIKIENIEVINELLEKEQLEFSVISASKKMIAQYQVMKTILRFKKPKVVFLTVSYSSYGYIKAFKERGIKVVEIQHGVINTEHYGYNLFSKFSPKYFPDYLITFGRLEQNVFTGQNNWLTNSNIIPAGSYYIDYICKHFQLNKLLENKKKNYLKTVGVSLQDCNIGEAMIPNLIKLATESKDILYLLKPRGKSVEQYESEFTFPDNIHFENELNVYEVILHSDYHMTAYSSCALEAPAMGVKNILFNLQNKAFEYYSEILSDNTTVYLSQTNEIIDYIHTTKIVSHKEVKENHSNVIINNYKTRMDLFLKSIE